MRKKKKTNNKTNYLSQYNPHTHTLGMYNEIQTVMNNVQEDAINSNNKCMNDLNQIKLNLERKFTQNIIDMKKHLKEVSSQQLLQMKQKNDHLYEI